MLVLLPLLLVVACGDDEQTVRGDGPQAYEADGTVLESPEHGPELCLGGVAESYPPQCGGVPITNWDWDEADGEESASGTTWGSYHVVGTYDGEAFTLTEPPTDSRPAPTEPEGAYDFTTPCPEPEGGWASEVTDPARATQDAVSPASEYASAQDDYGALWLDWIGDDPTSEEQAMEPGAFVLNAAFTGDLAEHEARLRELWGGPLCVSRSERTSAELQRIQQEVSEELGADLLSSGVDEPNGAVYVHVLVATDEQQRALDERYGEGLVHLTGALRPVG